MRQRRNTVHWAAACLALFFAAASAEAGEWLLSPYSAATVRPEPRFVDYNPAFALTSIEDDLDVGTRLPLGVLSLLVMPDRSPLLYLTDSQRFRDNFDFVSAYDQLRYPTSWLLNPGRSPEEIIMKIDNETIVIETDEGESLSFGAAAGAGGVSRPFTALIPPSLVAYHYEWHRLYVVTGLFLAPTGHSLRPDADLEDVLEGEAVAADETYRFDVRASATAGISQSFILGFDHPLRGAVVKWAPRLVTYYRAATLETHYRGTLATDSAALPDEVAVEDGYFVSYPGNGWGVGGRFDAGAVLETDQFTGGVSVLNIAGFNAVTGSARGLDGKTGDTRRFSGALKPAVVLTGRHVVDVGRPTLVSEADILFGEAMSAHLAGSLFYPRWMFRLLGGFKAGWEASCLVGLRRPTGSVALSVSVHQSVFTRAAVWGVGILAQL